MMHISVILQTGSSDRLEIEKALKMGASCYIKKPYDRTEVIRIIDNVASEL